MNILSTKRHIAALVVCLLPTVIPAVASAAQVVTPCTTPLAGLGPINPVHGFPEYYIDSTGLALQPCLDLVCDPALPVPDPAQPVSFPDNFPDEFFYSRVINTMNVGSMRVLYVAALEGSFANGAVVTGDQVVFARIRFRILGATPNATYTFTHPYGVDVVQADGVGFVNDTTDVGLVPVGLVPTAFQLSLGGRVGPFIRFLAGPVPPPPGTIGNPAADQTVTGSACGQNFVRVEGPGFPRGGQQNNLFGTIIGKIAPICGNGTVDPTEQCDDGNTLNGDCCSSTCQFEPARSPCTGTNVCVTATTCDGAGVCGGGTPTPGACNDGNACTTADSCAGGVCVGGPALNCNDGNVCTDDTCNPATGCVNTPNTAPCSDGNACTTADTCANGTCVGGPAANCNDGNVCTDDSCNPASGCVNAPNTAACSDGNICTTADTCAGGVCVGGPPLVCPTAAPVAAVTADTYVQSDLPTTNFGAKTLLAVDNGVAANPGTTGVQRTLLRVTVSGVGPRQVTSARVRLQVAKVTNAQSVTGGRIHAIADCGWNERTVTWNTQPLIDGPALATLGAVAQGQTVDFDVTSAIPGDGVYCFALDTLSTDSALYNSREATAGKPLVAVTATCPCAPATTTTTTVVPGATTTTTLPPAAGAVGTVVADTYVQSDMPTTNFGTKPQLFVDNGVASNPGTTGVQRTFLRVNVSGVGARAVSSAHLTLQVANATNANSVTGGSIHAITSCSWSETAMTWNTQPAIDGPALATLGAVAIGQVADFDVTAAIPGDGVYCFAIDTASTDSAIYNSREGALQRPAVTIQVAP